MAKKEPWNKTRHGTLPHDTIVKVQLFGRVIDFDDEFYTVILYGQDGDQLTESDNVYLKTEDILMCRKHPELNHA